MIHALLLVFLLSTLFSLMCTKGFWIFVFHLSVALGIAVLIPHLAAVYPIIVLSYLLWKTSSWKQS